MKHDLLAAVEPLFTILEQRSFLVAYSGGLDSHVLLHLMSRVPDIKLRAIHIDHGLQQASPWWGRHCREICSELDIPFEQASLNLQVPDGQSLEAYAREARYQALAKALNKNEVLLTGHHQNDQVETLLIQLLRGAGGAGLAAMPMMSGFALGSHMRPLLNFTREQLEDYADHYKLSYVEDGSNADLRFDRNYLRHQIIPQLVEHWPGCVRTLSRAALIQGETQRLLDFYVAQDVEMVVGSVEGTLSVDALIQCEPVRRRALLRYWISASGFQAPSSKKLQHVVSDVLFSAEDAMPCVQWSGAEVRRFHGNVYIMAPLSEHDAKQVLFWDLQADLPIESLGIELKADVLAEWKTKLSTESSLHTGLTVRFRQGGEVMHPAGRNKSIPLKQIFQQLAVPPWLRQRIPLLYLGDELIMAYGVCQVEP
ncbi:MAG: tRNA lysidine(34) synthetase TilS [Proteobacteria bacterium]|nr:MAG: tRNA lysidine(34) synthetase TilS [Pseudomonadota bacterium]